MSHYLYFKMSHYLQNIPIDNDNISVHRLQFLEGPVMKNISWFLALVMETILAALVGAAEFSCLGGDVSCLIASINSANQTTGKHTIALGPGIYTLTVIDNTVNGNTTLPIIARNIKIRATSNTQPTAIESNTGGGINSSRIFFVSNFGNLTLSGIILQNSVGSTDLLRNLGTTSILNSIITGSKTLDPSGSSAVLNFGNLTIADTFMDFNQGSLNGGGAITNELGGFASIKNSTIAHNVSFLAGIVNRGSLSIKKSALLHNNSDGVQSGGAILNLGGTVNIVSSTITGNAAATGGAVFNRLGTVSLLNSTVAENISRFGGALFNSDGLLRLQNTIVAKNIDTNFLANQPDCRGDIASLGNNIIGDVTGCNINLEPSDRVGDPGLGALVGDDDDTIPGQTYYPLLAGSSAINAGNNKACPATDQLKNRRVGICDIGAIEFQNQALVN